MAIRSSSTPAHRELIDMVMAVREADKITQLDHVSKTKVRGVLALLKHGELLITQGAEGEPVRLYLAPGINTFRDLRERHDVFLSRYMLEHHLFVPAILKSELVWHFEEETRARRLDALDQLVAQLHFFYKSYLAHVAETEETGAPPARAAHSEDATGLLLGPSTAGEDTSLCGGSRLSLGAGSDMGSTARETSSDRSSYRSSDTGIRSSWSSASKEDWGFSRPQSLPVQGSSARDSLAEQRPKSIAGFTPHQHSSKVDRGYPFQGPPFQQSGGHGDNPSMPRNVANGGGGGMGYSLWGGQGFGSSDSADRSSGRLSLDLSAQQQQQQHLSGDFGLFSDEAFRNAPPQLRQPAFPIDRNAAAYGAVDEPSYLSGYGGSVGGRPGSYRHAPPQVMGDFHHRHQPQQQGQGVGSHWTSASNQQQLGSHHMSAHTARTVGRDPQYPPSFAGQHSAGQPGLGVCAFLR